MPYKLLAIDLDGTLLVGEDLPPANREALREASAEGYHVVIATARWRQMAERVCAQIGVNTPVIACSGAQVFDPALGKDLFDYRLPLPFVRDLFALCDSMRCVATVTVGDHGLLKLDGEPIAALVTPEIEWVPELTPALREDDLPRIAAIQGSAINAAILQDLAPSYPDVNFFDSKGPTGRSILTITGRGADKGAALAAACAHMEVEPADAVAFGDAENDIEMFRVAGASVAMGQAGDDVKAAATIVTTPNTEAGVARAVRTLLETGSLT